MSESSLNERVIRTKVSRVLKASLTRKEFIPANATRELKRWFLSLNLTIAERNIVEHQTKLVLEDFKRRVIWIGTELDQDVFKRFGG